MTFDDVIMISYQVSAKVTSNWEQQLMIPKTRLGYIAMGAYLLNLVGRYLTKHRAASI